MNRLMRLAIAAEAVFVACGILVMRDTSSAHRQAATALSISTDAYEAERRRLAAPVRTPTTEVAGSGVVRGEFLGLVVDCATSVGAIPRHMTFREGSGGLSTTADFGLRCQGTDALLRFIKEVEDRCGVRVVVQNLEFFSEERDLVVTLDFSSWARAQDGVAAWPSPR